MARQSFVFWRREPGDGPGRFRHAVRETRGDRLDTERHRRDRADGLCAAGRDRQGRRADPCEGGSDSGAGRDPAIRLEVRTQIRLLELAASELQDEWLGFHLARNFDLREIGLLYYVIASSECLEEALRNAERYSRIMNEGVRLRFGLQDRTATIALDYVDVDRNTDRHQIEFWLVTLVRICRG